MVAIRMLSVVRCRDAESSRPHSLHACVSTGNPGARVIHSGLEALCGDRRRILRSLLASFVKLTEKRLFLSGEPAVAILVEAEFRQPGFTVRILRGGPAETPDPPVGVVRCGQSHCVHQAGRLAPTGVRRGNVTAALNSCAIGLVGPEFSERPL